MCFKVFEKQSVKALYRRSIFLSSKFMASNIHVCTMVILIKKYNVVCRVFYIIDSLNTFIYSNSFCPQHNGV